MQKQKTPTGENKTGAQSARPKGSGLLTIGQRESASAAAQKIGVVSAHPKGFGFVTTDEGEEYFVTPPQMRSLVPGDRVSFSVEAGTKPGQFQAGRCRLVERKQSVWQGPVVYEDGRWRLEPDAACFVRLYLADTDFVAPGSVVSVRLAPKGAGAACESETVALERVLGERTRKGFDVDYALAKFDFLPGFVPQTLQAAARVPQAVETVELLRSGREDLRATPFVTIDGDSTRDFDDAVHVKALDDGFLVQVAIVDVSHYVRPGSPLDVSARKRATSVYLPGKVVPMLPEALSHGICSLNPGVERLAVVVSMHLDAHGNVLSQQYCRAVIVSQARLTYRQVADVMENGAALTGSAGVAQNLAALAKVYALLASQRKSRGVLDFEDPEPVLRVAEDGEFTLAWEHRTVAHKLIEELMLLTNQCVAHMVFERHGVGMFRHQPLPDQADWDELVNWASSRGLELPQEPSLKALSLLPAKATSAEERAIVELRIRQVMNPAHYDTLEPAHFSLGFANYAHFTSPVRRYADLCVHRLLLGEVSMDEALQASAVQCSERSRSARLTERHVWDRLKKRILAREVPKSQELGAKAVAMSRRGLRVVINDWQCAAFVPAQDLLEEGFVWSADLQGWLRDGKPLEMGEQFTVRWVALEEERGQAELTAELI